MNRKRISNRRRPFLTFVLLFLPIYLYRCWVYRIASLPIVLWSFGSLLFCAWIATNVRVWKLAVYVTYWVLLLAIFPGLEYVNYSAYSSRRLGVVVIGADTHLIERHNIYSDLRDEAFPKTVPCVADMTQKDSDTASFYLDVMKDYANKVTLDYVLMLDDDAEPLYSNIGGYLNYIMEHDVFGVDLLCMDDRNLRGITGCSGGALLFRQPFMTNILSLYNNETHWCQPGHLFRSLHDAHLHYLCQNNYIKCKSYPLFREEGVRPSTLSDPWSRFTIYFYQ